MTNPSHPTRSTSKINYICTALVSLPLISNAFSRTMAEYFFDLLILTVLFFSAFKIKDFRWNNLFLKTGFNSLWAFFIGIIILGYVANGTLGEPQIRNIAEFLWIFGMFLYARMLKSSYFSKKFFFCATVGIILLATWLIIDFFVHPPYDASTWGLPNRLMGTFTNTNFLAQSYYLVFLFVVGQLVTHLSFSKDKLMTRLLVTAIVAMGICLLLTFNRSILIASFVVLPIALFLWKRKATLISLGLISATVIGLYIANIGNFSIRVHQTLNPATTGDLSRINLWKTNLYIFAQNPILGLGYYNNTRDIQKYYDFLNLKEGTLDTHAHNELISFLAGTGILGTLTYLCIFALVFFLAIKIYKIVPHERYIESGFLLGCAIIQPAFLITGLADNNFEIHAARNWLVVSWAIVIFFADKYKVQIPVTNKIKSLLGIKPSQKI